MIVYVASPMGFHEPGRKFYYSTLLPAVELGGNTILDPWMLTDPKLSQRIALMPFGPARRDNWRRLNSRIGRNNSRAITKCDAIVAVLDGSDVDSGTAAEIGFGSAKGKIIIGYRSDFRLVGDNEGARINLQVEYFIRASGGIIVDTLEQLSQKLKNIARKLPRHKLEPGNHAKNRRS